MPSIGDGDLDDFDDMMIFPLTDIDGDDNNNVRHVTDDDNEDDNGSLGYRAKQRGDVQGSGLFKADHCRPGQPMRGAIAGSVPLKINVNHVQNDFCGSSSPKVNWIHAIKKIRHLKDPWEKHHLTELPVEVVTRHRYHALKKVWVTDKVEVKVERESFDRGAMRACYRVKKLSSFSRSHNWRHAQNYVAKRYIKDEVARDVYFDDVRLQMDAKLWGEEFNRHNPPKKVDIFQMCVVEFENRPPGDRLYHLEHFIEGHYIKYNSNSGFVDENMRFTPQTFSHFTFERSGHQLIVVDIQGVGDLWTDPQVHTGEGKEYGDGNLGVKGMALFFHSHVCNSICESLGLSRFDLAPSEERLNEKLQRLSSSSTRIRGDEEVCVPASPLERSNLRMFFERSRRLSTCSIMSETSELSEDDIQRYDDMSGDTSPRFEDYFGSPMILSPLRHRQRFLSESEESSMSVTRSEEEDRIKFQLAACRAARPACVAHEINLQNLQNHRRLSDSVLGLIHHELAKYHEVGRFAAKGDQPDLSAAMFHEQFAADLGVKEAMLTLASIYFGLTHEVLVNVTLESTVANTKKGFDYMVMAANAGDRYAMLYLAKAYETGTALDSDGVKSYLQAVEWYSLAAEMVQEDECGEFDATMDTPLYELKAKMAELYLAGGYGLEMDASYAGDLYTVAAESATAAMKGRAANKYYALAEEAYAQADA